LTKGEIPGVQLSDAEAAAKQAELQYEVTQAQLTAMKLGPRTEAVAEAEARVKTADALVDSAQAQLDLLTLRSPIDGVLESLSCQMGQTISVGTVLGNVVDARQLLVTVWLPAKVLERVAVGQTARIASKGVEQDLKASAENAMLDEVGEVTFVGKVADAQTGNIPVQLTIDNAKGHFSVGQMVSAVITIDEKKNILAVPTSAVFDVGDGSAICVIRDGKSVRTRGQFGVHDGHWIELLTTEVQPTLTAGEIVIVEGGYNLPDGTDVHGETSEVANTENHLTKSQDSNSQPATPASQESTR
jgi:RND family efflux transporter MFP subunit